MLKERRQEQTPERVAWQSLILAAEAGLELSTRDRQALEIRETCFNIADYVEAVGEGRIKDPTHEAQLVANYWDSYQTLDSLGVTTNIHCGKPKEAFQDPLTIAEYMGGQWQAARGNESIPMARALRQIQEMSDVSHKLEGMLVPVVKREHLTPDIRNWMVMRSMVNMTHRFLVGDLGRPQIPKQDSPQDLPQ